MEQANFLTNQVSPKIGDTIETHDGLIGTVYKTMEVFYFNASEAYFIRMGNGDRTTVILPDIKSISVAALAKSGNTN